MTELGVEAGGRGTSGPDVGSRLIRAMVRGQFEEMRSLLDPNVRFRALTPHKFIKTSKADPADGLIRVFRQWFHEDVGDDDQLAHPVELLAWTVAPFGGGGRYKLSYRIRAKSLEMVEEFRVQGLAELPDDVDWLVEQEAYYDVLDGRIAWMIVLCGGFQPLTSTPITPDVPETDASQIVI